MKYKTIYRLLKMAVLSTADFSTVVQMANANGVTYTLAIRWWLMLHNRRYMIYVAL